MKHSRRFRNRRHRTEISQKEIDEYLEILWYFQERHGANMINFPSDKNGYWDDSVLSILKENGFIEETRNELKFTQKGYNHARQIVRAHRLAERLLTDVLNMKPDSVETGACEFEHMVVPEIVDGICTLLGHPKVCPHGLPIPEGACCKEARSSVATATKSLAEVKSGQEARVAYINTNSNRRMHQLTQLGIQPGKKIKVHQTYPALVIKIDSTQLALDNEVAKDILVWD